MSSNFRHIIRVAGTDLDGYKKLGVGLIKIKGVGLNLAKVMIKATGLDPNIRIGFLNDNQVRIIREAIENIEDQMVPNWMLNRQKDLETGRDLHKIGPNLILTEKNDVDSMRKMKSWKGTRHSLGLKVRGQRTKTTGRTGRSVGVRRKRLLERMERNQ
jgi:small subunit ribosomal protein S13